MWTIVFFLLPLAGMAYSLWHVWGVLPWPRAGRIAAVTVCVMAFLTLFLNFSRTIDRLPLWLGRVCYEVGNSSIFVLLYLVMAFLLLDIGRLVRLVPGGWLHSNGRVACAIAVLMVGVFTAGYLHYRDKQRVAVDLALPKAAGHDVRVVALSDLHLGYHNPRKELARWVDMINAEHADAVLIAGDLIDISLRPLREEDMAAELRRIEAPVFACLGNHEYYSGVEKSARFFSEAGITLLRDSVATIGPLTIIGRDDRSNRRRKSLKSLTATVDKERSVVVVLDHQPYNLGEAEAAGVDFQFSGHTHDGQVWPVSMVTRRLYECSYGPWQRGATHYYVSSGMGIWGGKFRIGTQSEYVVAEIHGVDS